MASLTFFPFSNSTGDLNIVSGTEAIAARILHLLLLQKGENPLYPDMGLAPSLFIPLSSEAAYAFRYEAQQMLTLWGKRLNIGFDQVWVESETIGGKVKLKVTFTVSTSDQVSSLSLDYEALTSSRSDPQTLLNLMEFIG